MAGRWSSERRPEGGWDVVESRPMRPTSPLADRAESSGPGREVLEPDSEDYRWPGQEMEEALQRAEERGRRRERGCGRACSRCLRLARRRRPEKRASSPPALPQPEEEEEEGEDNEEEPEVVAGEKAAAAAPEKGGLLRRWASAVASIVPRFTPRRAQD